MVGVAQLVERWIVIPVVVGSIPIVHPIFLKGALIVRSGAFLFLLCVYGLKVLAPVRSSGADNFMANHLSVKSHPGPCNPLVTPQ